MLLAYGIPILIPLKLKGSLGKTFHVVLLSCINELKVQVAGLLECYKTSAAIPSTKLSGYGASRRYRTEAGYGSTTFFTSQYTNRG
jgi:hypothetical protein